jgi:hypothetical protein
MRKQFLFLLLDCLVFLLSQCKRITSDFRMGTRQPDGRMV